MVRTKRPRIVYTEEELYPYVMAVLLSGRGKVYPQHKIGHVMPDFVVDGGVWKRIVEVKLFDSEKHIPQLEEYERYAETCVALPTKIRGWWKCYIPIRGNFYVLYKGAGEASKRRTEEVPEEAQEAEEEA